eukprot:GFUD01033006.1.p1 GENE.GFUD01033006.1~~GFUD01033006.1.p1  ORF type:complete len:244 (+),score=54.29 GFUD01033006.1:47-733(+)
MSSTTPTEGEDLYGEGRWRLMHQRFVSETRDAEPEILWVGDSIIQNLLNSRIWETSFCLMHSLNFGISGDRTENVLWRLQNGELENLSPKMIVLSVGQENYGDTPEKIAEGVQAICALIRSKQPQAFLIVLTLLPRGNPDSPLRQRNRKVNEMMTEYVKGNSRVQLVNIDTGFVQVDDTISHHDMFDYMSLTQKGYSKAFEPVNELLTQLLQEMEGEVGRTEAEGAAD